MGLKFRTLLCTVLSLVFARAPGNDLERASCLTRTLMVVTKPLFSPLSFPSFVKLPGSQPGSFSLCYTAFMFSERIVSGVVALAVVLVTVGFFVIAEPEEKQVVSEDGILTLVGLARQTQPFIIDEATVVVREPLLGRSYHVSPDEVTLDEPAVISFALSGTGDTESQGIFRYRSDLMMWEKVEPVVAHEQYLLAVRTGQLGHFAVGRVETFEAPTFVTTYDALRAMAPENAVGYETVVGYSRPNAEVIRLYNLGESGGCGGTVRVGDGEESSRLVRDISLTIDDQSTPVTFTFVTRWFTSSAGGCRESEPLQPLVEYDILPTS